MMMTTLAKGLEYELHMHTKWPHLHYLTLFPQATAHNYCRTKYQGRIGALIDVHYLWVVLDWGFHPKIMY